MTNTVSISHHLSGTRTITDCNCPSHFSHFTLFVFLSLSTAAALCFQVGVSCYNVLMILIFVSLLLVT